MVNWGEIKPRPHGDLYGRLVDWLKFFGVEDSQLRYYAQSLPLVGDLVRFYEGDQKANDYLKNRGLSWSDVKYATSLPSGSLAGTIPKIEKNVDAIAKLYAEDGPKVKPIRYNRHGEAFTSRNFYDDY